LPKGYDNHQQLLKKHESWIYKKVSHIRNSQKQAKNRKLDMKRSDEELKDLILSYVKSISQELDVKINKVRFRRMKSRWGSCSSNGNLNFNRYLKYLPIQLIEYIVFHEVAHLLEMGHNKKFWNIISLKFPDYKKMEDELLIYWLSVKDLVGIK
jgi:predicted metal-dependent hydrolase